MTSTRSFRICYIMYFFNVHCNQFKFNEVLKHPFSLKGVIETVRNEILVSTNNSSNLPLQTLFLKFHLQT